LALGFKEFVEQKDKIMANFWVDPVRFLSELLLWFSFVLVCIKVVFKDVNNFFTYLKQLSDHSSKEMNKELQNRDSSDDGVKIDTFGNYGYPLVLQDSRPRRGTSLLDYDHEQHEMNRKMSVENLYTHKGSEPYKLFGKLVDDKHRWMEESLDSNLMKKWMSAQNKCANKLIRTRSGGIPPLMHSLRDKILEAHQLDEIDTIFQRGEHFFYYRRLRYSTKRPNILQLYMTKKLNADCFSTSRQASGICHTFKGTTNNGKSASNILLEASEEEMTIHATWICNDGAKLAYAYSSPGSKNKDWVTIGIRDTLTGEDYREVLSEYCHVANLSLTWHSKDTGFFYSCMTEGPSLTGGISATAQHRVCFHRLGSEQSEDLVVCDSLLVELGDKKIPAERTIGSEAARGKAPGSPSTAPFPTNNITRREFFYPRMSHCSSYLLIDVCEEEVSDILCMKGPKKMRLGDRSNKFFFLDATNFDGEHSSSLGSVVKLIDGRGGDFTWEYITNVEVDFFMRTNYGADHFRVVRITVPAIDHIESQAAKPDSEQRLQFMLQACWHTALEWIPETADGSYLERSGVAAQTVLVLKYIRGSASHDLVLYDLTQSLDDSSRRPCAELPNPPYGIIEGPYCNFYSNSIFYRSSSFSDPGSIWRANITRSSITHTVEVGFEPIYFGAIPNVNTYQFETRQEVCTCSTDESFAGFHFNSTNNRDSSTTTLPRISGHTRNSEGKDEVPYFMVHTKDSIEEKTVVVQDKVTGTSINTIQAATPKNCILYVYGSFGVSLVPVFSLPLLLYIKHFDAILCVVQARGGGELGKGWQAKGQGVFKQNTVADVISVASDLVEKGFTTKDMLSLMSGSFGSAIAAACLNQRPDLFAAAVMEDGIFDLLRYDSLTPSVQWFEQTASMREMKKTTKRNNSKGSKAKNGSDDDSEDDDDDGSEDEEDEENKTLWIEEFGSASASEEECDRLYQLSPLHNVRMPSQEQKEVSLKEGRTLTFPAVLCIASSKSRVPPLHSFKYVSELQSTWGSRVESGPIMLHIDEHQEDEEDEDEDTDSGSDSDSESEVGTGKNMHADGKSNNHSHAQGEHHEIHEHLSRASVGLYFIASRTGAVFREDFATVGESGRMEAGFSSDDFGEDSEEASEDDDVADMEDTSHRQSIVIDDDDDDDEDDDDDGRDSRTSFYDHRTSTRYSQPSGDGREKSTSRISQAGSALKGMGQKLRSSIASGGSSIRSSISQAISTTGGYLSTKDKTGTTGSGASGNGGISADNTQTSSMQPNLYSNQRR
jgi:prolyl oligopeptidase PreP (S9A serine peptidase family)